jgi:DNA invertase Pin-like site-specific DNA recombinase
MKKPTNATPPADAFSYLRFSSPAQADDDSVRRQTALRDAWLKRHPEVRLDTSLVLEDRGVSGYRGEHRTNRKHALAHFLDLVERGRVPAGSYLIVENLDRLTREEPEVSIPLVMSLIGAGVRVVQLVPTEIVYEPGMDFGRLMMMLWELARGHQESKRKSGTLGEVWGAKKAAARADKTPYGKQCPSWLELADGKYRVREDAARTVRLIFRWCADGLGLNGILAKLNAESVPPIGRVRAWDRAYVYAILTNPAVVGVYQPHVGSRKRKPEGEPIEGYFPRVVDDALWHAAHDAMQARKRKSGRPPRSAFNPFSGLLYSALDGSKLHVLSTDGNKYLVSRSAIQKHPGAQWRKFPLPVFVDAVLGQLRELAAADLFADPGAAKVAELTGRLGEVERRLAVAVRQFDADPESATWQERVTKYDKEKRALLAELAEARREAANPLSANWADAVALMRQKDPTRLRAALLATVDSIWCLLVTVGRARHRVAAVQVFFKGGQRRDYLILLGRGTGGAVGTRPARWQARSLAGVVKPGALDLRVPDHARRLEKALGELDPADLENGD